MKFRNQLRFLISIFALTGGAFVSAAAIVTFDAPSNISEGQVFDIKVIIDPHGAAMGGAQMDFLFDKSNMQVNSIKEGDLFKKEGTATLFNPGTIDNSNGDVRNVFIALLKNANESPRKYVSSPGIFIVINARASIPLEMPPINYSNVIIVELPKSEDKVYPAPTSTQIGGNDDISIVSLSENDINLDYREKSYPNEDEKVKETVTILREQDTGVGSLPAIFAAILMVLLMVYKYRKLK